MVIESAIGRTEMFIRENGKLLLGILAAVVIVVGGFFAYKYLYVGPRQEKAATAMFQAQNYFAADSFELALNGDGNAQGFLQIVDKYGSTPSGNLARHYAGQCYLRLGQYQEAVKYFDRYKDAKGIPAQLINAMNAGLTGDAYIQMGDLEKGVKMYEKAVSINDNQVTAPYYSRKAGQVYQQMGDYGKALEWYRKVKNEYPGTMEWRDIDKYIGQVEQKL